LRDELVRLQAHVSGAEVLINTFGPLLPKGLIPEGAADALAKAKLALGAVQGVEADGLTPESVKQVADAAQGLLGASPVVELLKSASTVMPAISGLTPITVVALALGTAWQLGSDQYRRWVARVLDAPYDPQIISHGQISATSAAIALEQSPIFAKAFNVERQQPAFVSDLLTQVLSDEGAENLWAKYGSESNRFASRGELDKGLIEFRSVLLWNQSSQDITTEQIQSALAPLAGTSLAPTATPSLDTVNDVLKQIGQSGANDPQHIAMEALILWVGYMRKINLDPVHLLAQIWRP
jgi:hypothetical protein